MLRPDLSILITIVTALLANPTFVHAVNYPAARALSAHLAPKGFPSQADSSGMAQAKEQMIQVLNVMEESETSGGPGADDLLKQAYVFREDVGPAHRASAAAALSTAWREARGLGLFNAGGKFTTKITKGVDAGKECRFEYIVPVSLSPQMSRDVSNLRIVPPSKARVAGAAVTPREQATAQAFEAVVREAQGMKSVKEIEYDPKTNAVGQTTDEALKMWKEQMQKDGVAALELPSISLRGKTISTPSKKNGEKWIVQADVHNLSNHATEVELECLIIGITDKNRERYLMAEVKQKVRLRPGQIERIAIPTPLTEGGYKAAAGSYEKLKKSALADSQANYRGAVFRVNHGKGVAAVTSTDPTLLTLLEKDDSGKLAYEALPKLYGGGSKK